MQMIQLKARAKINLSLDVVGKRPDGYHEVKMIMQTIDLYDDIFIEQTDHGISIECGCPWVPENCDNIAYKAAQLLVDNYNIKGGIKIRINKNIPVAAGLAGGSSDAASVIKGINKIFDLGINEAEMMLLGKQIGADVPYCIKGGTMLAEGIGEVLTELPALQETHIVLVKPKIGVSTPWVYKNLRLDTISQRPDTELLINSIKNHDKHYLAANMVNVLETVTIPKYTVIQRIKEALLALGALGSMMSGSGPSVFGIFDNSQSAEKAYIEIKKSNWDCFLTKSVQ
ncbi:MAG: 4-(cytidine 5'-diphospho)-2-C-methyl-D-erythritol kinase [Clostridia bacterium]|nr:4-(cytidine 5'-diphospho)-2-C-methyl-D-erythritol kinase [Clostridia bacterium]